MTGSRYAFFWDFAVSKYDFNLGLSIPILIPLYLPVNFVLKGPRVGQLIIADLRRKLRLRSSV